VIHFKNEKENRITKTVQTTDSKAIRRILEFIDNQPTDSAACGFDGKMFFYRQRERIQEVDFNIKDSRCSRFSLILDGQLISTKLSGEAADFLGALERGDLFY